MDLEEAYEGELDPEVNDVLNQLETLHHNEIADKLTYDEQKQCDEATD